MQIEKLKTSCGSIWGLYGILTSVQKRLVPCFDTVHAKM